MTLTTRIALAASLLLAPGAACAQMAGSVPGMLLCDGAPGMTAARVPVTITMAEDHITYAFAAPGPSGQPSGKESGGGAFAPGRPVVLTGSARGAGFSYQARYSGDIAGRGGLLGGTQTGTADGHSFTRRCQMSLGNGRG